MTDAPLWRRSLRNGALPALAVSEALFHGLGGRLDDVMVADFWQYLDVTALRDHLFQSLWYLHAQPPGMNLWLGLSLALGSAGPRFLELCLLLASFALLWSFGRLLGLMGVGPRARVGLVFFLALSPPFVMYGHAVFYTQFEAALLTGALVAMAELVALRRLAPLYRLAGCLAALSLIRSTYHLLFIVVAMAIASGFARYARLPWKRLVLPWALALVLPCGVFVKNWVEFGAFTSSTWMGMNLSKSVHALGKKRLARLHRDGVISERMLLRPFPPPGKLALTRDVPAQFRGVPVLAEPLKADGGPNYNHFGYIAFSNALRDDALSLAKEQPATYWEVVEVGLRLYLDSTSECFVPFSRDGALMDRWQDAMEPFLYARRPREAKIAGLSRYEYPVLMVAIPLLTLLAAFFLCAPRACAPPQRAVLALGLFAMLYIGVLLNLFELGENARFRYPLEPLYLAVAALTAGKLVRALRAPFGRHAAPVPH